MYNTSYTSPVYSEIMLWKDQGIKSLIDDFHHKRNHQHMIIFLFGFCAITNVFYKHSVPTARENLLLQSQGSRAKLKQTLSTIMVSLNETIHHLRHQKSSKPLFILNCNLCRCLTEIKPVISQYLSVISEAGNAVCGAV